MSVINLTPRQRESGWLKISFGVLSRV